MSVGYRVVHRRNAAVAGLMLILAALAFALSAVLPLAHLSGPHLSVMGEALGVDVTPGGDIEPSPAQLWLWTGGFVLVFGIALLATRVRGLGIVWRVLAFIPIGIMGAYAGLVWYIVQDPAAALSSGNSGSAAATSFNIASDIGLIHVAPGAGLILLSCAVAFGIVALFVPAIRSQYVPPAQFDGVREGTPPGGAWSGYPATAPETRGYPPQNPWISYPPGPTQGAAPGYAPQQPREGTAPPESPFGT